MKFTTDINSLFLLAFCLFLSNKLAAQTEIWSVDAANYVGKMVTFAEYANKVTYNPNTKICQIKLADPDVANSPTITVIIHHVNKGRHLLWLQNLQGFTITITGRLMKAENRFVINGNDTRTKIVDEKSDGMIEVPVPEVPPVPLQPDTVKSK
jgi:hypothetical protein